MCESASWIQATYCFPVPSEYFLIIHQKVNNTKSYLEQHIYFHNAEKYKEWYAVFGEIMEELMEEIQDDFSKNGISCRRFFDDVEICGVKNAELMHAFETKFNENNPELSM